MENQNEKLDKVVEAIEKNNDLVYKFVTKTHDTPSDGTIKMYEKLSTELNETGKKLAVMESMPSQINELSAEIKEMVKDFREGYVSKELFNSKVSSLKSEIKIYVGIGIFIVTLITNFIMDKLK